MYISREITGLSGWIGNPSGITGNGYLRLAHCTADVGLCRGKAMLLSHMESGKPYALACTLNLNEVLLVRPSLDLNELRTYRASIIRSGYLEDEYCRTQVILKLHNISSDEFIDEALGNHHVIIPYGDDVVEALRFTSWLLGMRFILK